MQYIVLYSIRLYFHHQKHPQLGIVSALTQIFIPPGAISLFSPVAFWTPSDLRD